MAAYARSYQRVSVMYLDGTHTVVLMPISFYFRAILPKFFTFSRQSLCGRIILPAYKHISGNLGK